MQAKAVEVKSKEKLLEELERRIREALELKEKIERLVKELQARYSSSETLSVLVEQLIKISKPPEIPLHGSELEEVNRKLSSYVSTLDDYIKRMNEASRLLEEILTLEEELKEKAEIASRWAELAAPLNSYVASETLRAVSRARKLLASPSLDLKILREELRNSIRELDSNISLCRRIVQKSIKSIKEKLMAAEKLYYQVRGIASVDDIASIKQAHSTIKEVSAEIKKIREEAPYYKADLVSLEEQVDKVLSFYRDYMRKALDEHVLTVLISLDTISEKIEKSLPLNTVVDLIHRRTGLEKAKILEALYFISSKNILPLKLKVG